MSISLIPESAPFTAEQRAWLNGFLAGWTGIADGASIDAATNGAVQQLLEGEVPAIAEAEEEEEFPWHDSALAIDERMELAEGRPMKRRMMAAMAQLNCGACGYLCQTYSEAIAAGEEKNLTLCSPGGKETAKMLKKLVKEEGAGGGSNGAATNGAVAGGAASNGATTNGAAAAAANGFTRTNPYGARITSCENLNREGSSKHTTHAVIDLGGDAIDESLKYVVGDALGVYPTNCPELVGEILTTLGKADDPSLGEHLAATYCLRSVNDELLELLATNAADDAEKEAVLALIDSDEVDGLDVLDALRRAPSAKLESAQFLETLTGIAPRLYSIASSINAHPGEVHLTIARATAKANDREYKGVASTMFSDRVGSGDSVKVYVHKSHGFTVPADPSAPMVMVGPGTGIAPFRAFLEEREVTKAPGKNWLFFGDQHAATDFLYEEQLGGLQESGVLTKLSTAFSRDQEEKVYVQDRMREEGDELWSWLEAGGYFFVCGDARRMAVDVEKALHDVIVNNGGKKMAEAMAYVAQMKADQRYVRDVY